MSLELDYEYLPKRFENTAQFRVPGSCIAAMFGRYWLVVHSHSTPRFHDPKLLWPTISQKLFIENQTTATLKVLDTSNEAMIESSHFRNLIAAESFNIISCVRSALTSMCKPGPVQGSTRTTARNKQCFHPLESELSIIVSCMNKKIKHTPTIEPARNFTFPRYQTGLKAKALSKDLGFQIIIYFAFLGWLRVLNSCPFGFFGHSITKFHPC